MPDSLSGMLLLALDTATSAVTVALHDGHRVLAEATTVDPRAHGEHLAPGIAAVLSEAGLTPGELTHVVSGLGPGPFTGLRVGIVTARVLALVTGAAAHGLCSLDALAYAAAAALPASATELLVATDARRKEVYWARYQVTRAAWTAGAAGTAGVERDVVVTAVTPPAVDRPADLPEPVRALPTAGRGPLLYPELFTHPVGPHDVAAAAVARLAVARLARGDTLADREPYYLRRPDAAPNVTRKSALG